AKMLVRLVDARLDFSRIIGGKLILDPPPRERAWVIEAAIEAVRPAAAARDIRIETKLEPRVDVIRGDPERLQQVVWNLLSNAIKFTPEGGRVDVTLQRVDAHLELTVSDTGRGVAPGCLPHLFER